MDPNEPSTHHDTSDEMELVKELGQRAGDSKIMEMGKGRGRKITNSRLKGFVWTLEELKGAWKATSEL